MSDDKRILPRSEVKEVVEFIHQILPQLPSVVDATVCGSWRRGKAMVGDLDVAVQITQGKWKKAGEHIRHVLQLEGTKRQGQKYFDGLFVETVWMNFWLFDKPENLGGMHLHCTGSGGYNQWLRGRAKERGMLLNQYGLWRELPSGKKVCVGEVLTDYASLSSREEQIEAAEKDIFALLKLPFVPPKDREVGLSALAHTISNMGHEGVALALHRIGKEYQERAKKRHPAYHPSNRFKANHYLEAAKIAGQLPPRDWRDTMPGKSTIEDALTLLGEGRCPRMDLLGL